MRRAWDAVGGVMDWIDEHAALFLVVGLLGLAGLWVKVAKDEAATRATAMNTKLVQQQGAPVAVCLLEALEAVEPLLLKVPAVEKPLHAYVKLQSHRYPGVVCPDGVVRVR